MSDDLKSTTTHKSDENSAVYVLSFALLIGFAMVAMSIWFSVGSINDSIVSLEGTLLAKDMVVNVEGSNAQAQQQAPTQQEQQQAEDIPTATKKSVDISGRPIKGSENAKITIVEFSEFQCPYCTRAQATMKQIAETYGDDVNFVHVNFVVHESALTASVAVECAGEQDKYWKMHDKIFETQKTDETGLKEVATQLGLDATKFDACLKSEDTQTKVATQMNTGRTVGVSGTPSFIVGTKSGTTISGDFIVGAYPFETFKASVDGLLN